MGESNSPSHSTVAIKQTVATHFFDGGKLLKFSTDSVEIIIDTSDLSFKFVYQEDTVLVAEKIYNFTQSGTLVTNLKSNEKIYGTGSRAINLNRTGKKLQINNQAHYGYSLGTENLNITLPMFTSSEKYALFFDNHSIANFDIGSTNSDIITYSYNTGQADVFFIAGNSYKEITKETGFLTGFQPIPPLWSLGYIQSKYGYQSESQARNIVNKIRNDNFPLDALVLDLYWFGNQSTMGNLDWDNSNFPNPETMMSDFRDLGVKTILISEPYFTLASSNYSFLDANDYLAQNSSNESFVLYGFWTGDAALLDIFNPDAQTWMWQFYHDRTVEGAEAWWTDLGEPESHPSEMIHFNNQSASEIHNIYTLEWAKMISDNWQIDFPNKRLFNLSRSGFMGMQRYSTFPWSGDINRSFDGLKAQVPIMLSMGLNGIAYMHSDVGGFTGGGNDDELFIRWVQMGVFAPIFRIHGTGIETNPTAYGSTAKTITRNYIKLRYKLLPYNYTLAYENSKYGTPLARTMDFYDVQNTNLQDINDQYFWGENFIIAPILTQGQTQRNVILPEGKWLNYFSLQEYSGPGNFTMSAPWSNIPVLVKAGSFIPTVNNLTTTDDYDSEEIFVQFFPDTDVPNSSYSMYDDDKTTPNSVISNDYELINFQGYYTGTNASVTINSTGNGYFGMPTQRQLIFEIFRIDLTPANISIDGTDINEYNSLNSLLAVESGYFQDLANEKLYINVPYLDIETVVNISDFHVDNQEIMDETTEFSVYPNPGSEFLFVESSNNNSEEIKISIYSTSGVLVKYIENYGGISKRINTEDLNQGIYYIKIQNKTNVKTLKWIKE